MAHLRAHEVIFFLKYRFAAKIKIRIWALKWLIPQKVVSHKQREDALEIIQRSPFIEVKTTFISYMDTSSVRIYTEIKNISSREIVLEEVSAFVVPSVGDNSVENSKNLQFYSFLQSHHAECQPRKKSFYDYGLHRV